MMQQTNTADMLEEAVEYVKFLQGQIQVYLISTNSIELYANTIHQFHVSQTMW